jgi:NAD(P)-dependent dehydrogenase (short-subunit alcohol dehydrogenase family)
VPHFREKRAGLVINTTSIGGLVTVPFNSIYHLTKSALEGWSESMVFELNQFGIGMKTVSPGGMKTDFFTRFFWYRPTPGLWRAGKQGHGCRHRSQADGDVLDPWADCRGRVRSRDRRKGSAPLCRRSDAKATYAMRLQMGDEAFRKAISQRFFGQ